MSKTATQNCITRPRDASLAALHANLSHMTSEEPAGGGQADGVGQGLFRVAVKWQGRTLDVALPLDPPPTIATLKHALEGKTQVSSKRQKLLGCKPATIDDATPLACLTVPSSGLLLMGTPDAIIAAEEVKAAEAPAVLDDLDIPETQAVALAEDPAVLAKLATRVAAAKHVVLNAPRPCKKLMVLDIDYCIFDLGSSAERPEELARPHLHEFLEALYPHYDIVIWSATNMRWIQVKMTELRVLNNDKWSITALMCHQCMVTVGPLPGYGVFDCKPLAYLWRTFPQHYNDKNTIMLDDLGRNFVLNPQCGLKIRPFKHAHRTRDTDDELLQLKRYLLLLAPLADISTCDHNKWRRFLERNNRDA